MDNRPTPNPNFDDQIRTCRAHRPQHPHLYQRDVENIVNAILDETVAALARGDRVELRGFVGQASSAAQGVILELAPMSVDQKSVRFSKTGKEMRERLLNRRPARPRPAPKALSGFNQT